MRCLITLIVLCVGLLVAPARAQPADQFGTAQGPTIYSDILGEDRPIFVSAPAGYDPEGMPYPVIYLLDGAENYRHTVSTITHLVNFGRMPPQFS